MFAEVIVFLDVDGVLNADWHGLGLGRSEDLVGLVALEPEMLAAKYAEQVVSDEKRDQHFNIQRYFMMDQDKWLKQFDEGNTEFTVNKVKDPKFQMFWAKCATSSPREGRDRSSGQTIFRCMLSILETIVASGGQREHKKRDIGK